MATVVLPEPATQVELNVDDLSVNLDGAQVLAHLYGYDLGGNNWDRVQVTGGALDVNLAGGGAVDTELPAAALFADATANPTAPAVGSFLHGYNGADWDRLRSSIAQGLEVDVTRVQGNVAVTHAALTELAAAINASRMDVNVAASVALDVSAATVTVDTELPAAASLGDATANPTVPAVGSFLMGWNETTWDRLVSSIVNGLEVDVTRVQGSVAVTNAGLIELADAINANRMDVNIAASVALDVSAATVTVDTELTAAVALSDALANPTIPQVGAHGLLFDGTDWERLRAVAAPNALAGRVIGHQAIGKTEGKVTYRVAFKDLVAVAGVGVRIEGSASTIVRVTRIQISKPSVAQAPLRMVKTSTAGAGGTRTTPAGIPLDSADVAATAIVGLYTAAPAGGTEVGTGSIYESDIDTDDVLFETFGDEQNTQAVVLRGVAECLEIDLSANVTINGYIEWTEE